MANYTSQYTFGVSADTKSAQSSLNALTKSLREIQSAKYRVQIDDARITEASKAAETLRIALQNATNVNTGKLNLSQFVTELKTAGTSVSQLGSTLLNAGTQGQQAFSQLAHTIASSEAPVKTLNAAFKTMGTTLMNTIKWQASSSLIHGLMSSVSGAISYVKNLNSTLNDIRVVTGQSTADMARFAETANRMAKELSTSTNEFAKASLIYYQQGDAAELAAKKAAITTKAANVAFTASAQEMSEMLTAVWNSYQAGEDQLEHMVDVLAKLGATTASSMEEMATGMQKVAATANTVGVSMEQMSAMIATSASVTRQAPQTIGTAWNTILSRIGGLKLGETLEDGVDLNKYSKALQTIGVDILDANGNLRDMGGVIDEIGAKWDSLGKATKSALAQTIGGARQYTQILAFFENFDKYQANMKTAQNADGALQEQQEIYAESWEAASKRVKAAMEDIYGSLLNDQAMTKLTSFFADLINAISSLGDSFGGLGNMIGLIGSAIVNANLDKISTWITEAGTSIKQLFSGNQMINEYTQMLAEMRTEMEGLMARDDLSMSSKVELDYDMRLLAMKEKLAQASDQLTQKQKQEAQQVIANMESQKSYYINLIQQQEKLLQQSETAKKAAKDQAKEAIASAADAQLLKDNKATNYPEYQRQLNAANHMVDEIVTPKAYAELQDLAIKLGIIKDTSKEVTVDLLVQTLEKANIEAGKMDGILRQIDNTFAVRGKDGSVAYDVSAYLGSEEARKGMLTSMATTLSNNGDASIASIGQNALSSLATVDPSNVAELNKILHDLIAGFSQASVQANNAAEAVKKTSEECGMGKDNVKQISDNAREAGGNIGTLGDEAELSGKKFEEAFNAKLQKSSNNVQAFVKTAMTLQRITAAFTAISNAVDKMNDPDVSTWEKFTTVISTMVTVAMAASAVMQLMNTELIKNSLIQPAVAAASAATTAAKGAETVAWYASAAGVKAFTKSLLTNPITAMLVGIMALITGLVLLVDHLSKTESAHEKLVKKQKALNNSIEKTREDNEKLATDIGNLGDIMADTTLSYEEQIEKVNEITKAYGLQTSAVDALSGSYGHLKAEMSATTRGESDRLLRQANENVEQARAQIEEFREEQRDTEADWQYVEVKEDVGGWHTGDRVSASQDLYSEWQAAQVRGETDLEYIDWYNKHFTDTQTQRAYEDFFDMTDYSQATTTASLFTDDAWTANGWRPDKKTNGIWGKGASYYTPYLSDEGKLWLSQDWLDQLKELGFEFVDGNLREIEAGQGQLEQLFEILQTDSRFAPYVGGSGMTGQVAKMIGERGYNTLFAAEESQRQQSAVNALYHNPDFDLFKTAEDAASIGDTMQLIRTSLDQSGLTDEEKWAEYSNLNKIVGRVAGYSDASAKIDAGIELTTKLADIHGEQNNVSWKTKLLESLTSGEKGVKINGETFDMDIVLRLNPSAIEIDKEGNITKISKAAYDAMQSEIDATALTEKRTAIEAAQETATKKTINKSDYEELWATGIWETEEELTEFVKKSAAERTALWTKMIEENYENERKAIDNQVKTTQAYVDETKDAWDRWKDGFAQRARDAGQIVSDDDNVAYQEIRGLQVETERKIADLEAQKEALQAAITDTTKQQAYEDKYGKIDWANASDEVARLNGELSTNTNLLGVYNGLVSKGAEYEAAWIASTDKLTSAKNAQSALTYWNDIGMQAEKATNAVTAFTDAMSKSGQLTASELQILGIYSKDSIDTIIEKYNTLSEAEWAKYMYENALKYYTQLEDIYKDDAAMLLQINQEKAAAYKQYNDIITENAKEVAESQKAKWDEVRNAVSSVNSTIKDLTTGTKEFGDLSFEEIENLRNNLMTVYNDAEKVDALLKNLGKEDLSGQDKESILAAAKLKTEMLLESAAATEAERSQLYGGLASEMQSRIDSTRQINIEGKETLGGIYELMVTAPNAWNPDTGELTVYNPETGVAYTVMLAEAPQCAGYDPSTGILTISDNGGMIYHVNIGEGSSATGYNAKTGQLTVTAANDVEYKVNIGKGAIAAGYDETTGIVTLQAGNGLTYPVSLDPSTTAKGYDPMTGIITLTTATGTQYELSLVGTSTAKGYDPTTGTITLTTATGTTYTFTLNSDADNTSIFNPKTGVYTLQNGSGQIVLTTTFSDTNALKFDPTSGQLVTQTGEQIKLDASLGIAEITWDEETNTFSFYDATGTVTYTVGGIEGLSKSDAGGWKFDSDAQAGVKYTIVEGTAPETGTVTVTDEVTYEVQNPDAEPPADGETRQMEVAVTYKENTIGNIVQTRNALSDAYNANGRQLFEQTAKEARNLVFTDMTNDIVNKYGGDLRAYQVGTGTKTEDISKNIATIGKEVTAQWQKFVDQAGGDIAKAWEMASQDDAFMGGYNLFVGLVNGYKIAFGDYGNVFTDTSTDLLLQIMTSLGEHSPSVYTQEMGRYLMEGLSQGFENTEFTGAKGLQERVLNKIKNELNGLTADQQWTQIAIGAGVGSYATTENQMAQQMVNKGYNVIKQDGKWVIDGQIQENLVDAYNAFLTEQFSAQKLKEYLSSGYKDDLTLLQQYALNEAMTSALKKYNQSHSTNYKLEEVLDIDPSGFADLVQNELNTSNSKLLASTKTTVAQVKDLWIGVLDSVYKTEQATIQKTVDAWTNAWSAIIKARKTIWEENTSLFSALGEAEMKEVIAGWTKAGYSPEQIRAMALATDGSGARAVTVDPYIDSGIQKLGNAAYLDYDTSGRYTGTTFEQWRKNKQTSLREMASDADIVTAFQESIFGDKYISGKQAAEVANLLEGQDYSTPEKARKLLRDAGYTGSDMQLDKLIQATLLGQQNGGLSYDETNGWTELDFGEIVNKWLESQMGTEAQQREDYEAAVNTALWNDINYASQSRASTIEQGEGYLSKQQKDLDILNTAAEGLAEGKTLAEIFADNDTDLKRFQELMGESNITLTTVTEKSLELANAMTDCADAVQIAAEMIRNGMADSAIVNSDGSVTASKTVKNDDGSSTTTDYTIGANGQLTNAVATTTWSQIIGTTNMPADIRETIAANYRGAGWTTAQNEKGEIVATKIVTESLDTANIDLPEGVETGNSTVDNGTKLSDTQQKAINATYATNAGFSSVEELQEYANTLKEIGEITTEDNNLALKYASTLARQNKGFKACQDNMSKYMKTLKETESISTEHVKTMEQVRDIYADAFDLTSDQAKMLSKDFLESSENAELLGKAAKGDEEAWDKLGQAIADDLLTLKQNSDEIFDADGVKTQMSDLIGDIQSWLDNADLKVGAEIDDAGFINQCQALINQCAKTAEEASAALSSMGVDATIEEHTMTVPTSAKQTRIDNGYAEYAWYDASGGLHTESIPLNAQVTTTEGGQEFKWYTIKGAKYNGKGVTHGGSGSPSSSGSGGGGGSKKAKKVQSYKKGSDEKERYHEITAKLTEQGNILTKLDKIKSRTFGANHLKAINDEIAALEKEAQLYGDLAKEASVELEANKKILQSYGATFNEDGTINYEEYMDKILAQYNAAVDRYNSSAQNAGDELALKEAEEVYNEAKKAMEDYEEDMSKLNEAQENMLENQNKISAAMLEGIQYKVEVRMDLNDRDVKKWQYFRNKYEDFLEMQDESFALMTEEALKYEDNLSIIETEMNELTAAYANGTLNQADYAEGMQDVNDKMLEQLENLLTIKKTIKEAYDNTLQKANEELEKHTSVLEHSRNVMQSYIQMQQLMGLGADYSGLKEMYQMSLDASNASVAAERQHLETLKQSRKDIEDLIAKYGETDVLKQQLADVNAAIIESEDELLSATQQALEDAQSMFVNTMNAIVQDFDQQLFNMKNGLSKLEDDYAYYQETQQRYLSTSKELYEVAKLNRQIDASIADVTTKVSKERLKALQEQIKAQAESTRLTEYDVQMMELQYKHALALQELEDAKNAKSVVRLTRDENGNFGYQYTADDQGISDAQQKVDDALQAINELAANRVSEMEQAAVQAERQYRDSLLEIAQDTTLTLEERQAKMEELTRRHAETMQFNQEQYNNAQSALLTNQQYVYERYGVSIMTNTGDVQDQYNSSIASMMEKTTEYATYLQEQMAPGGAIYNAMQKYKSDMEIVSATSGLGGWAGMTASVDEYRAANEEAKKAIQGIEETLKQTLANIGDTTEAWSKHGTVLDQITGKYEVLAQAARDAVADAAGNIAGTTVGGASSGAAEEGAQDSGTGQKHWRYIWGYGGYAGTEAGYDSRAAAMQGAMQDMQQKIYASLEAGETDAETAANKAKLDAIYYAALGTRIATAYKTGGLIDYTGPAWVDGTREQPELMLNSTDTRNLLRTVDFVRELDMETLSALYNSINQGTLGMMYAMSGIAAPNTAKTGELQQNVTITADFPNATDRNEITAAFEDLVNLAAQYANR